MVHPGCDDLSAECGVISALNSRHSGESRNPVPDPDRSGIAGIVINVAGFRLSP